MESHGNLEAQKSMNTEEKNFEIAEFDELFGKSVMNHFYPSKLSSLFARQFVAKMSIFARLISFNENFAYFLSKKSV